MSTKTVYAIKSATGTWTIRVLAAPFGSPTQKDAHRQYFDVHTDFADEVWPLPPFVYYHGYDRPGKESRKPIYIGKATRTWTDDQGRWYEGDLDQKIPESKKVWDAALKKQAVGSPGTVEHLIRIGPNGHLDHWPIAEVSLFDQLDGKRPANNRAIALPVIKSLYQEAGLALPDIEQSLQATSGKGARSQRPAPATAINQQSTKSMETVMDPEELKQMIVDLVAQGIAEAMATQQAAAAAKAAEEAKMEEEVNKRVEAAKADMAKKAAADRRLPFGGGAPYVTQFAETSAYDNLDLGDQAVLVGVLEAGKQGGRSKYGATPPAMKALAIKAIEDTSMVGHRTRHALKAAGLQINPDSHALKANEINREDLTGYGEEWAAEAWSNTLWMQIREQAKVAMQFPTIEIPQGYDTIVSPLEGTPPTFYNVAGASDLNSTTLRPDATVPASKLGTDKKILDTSTMGARSLWRGTLEESSLIPWVSDLRRQLEEEGAVTIDHVCIDGDTTLTANTNINHIAGTPNAAAGYTTFNGLRKLALITNTANARDGGTAAFSDVIQTMKLLGANGINALNASKCAAIIDPNLNWKFLELLESTPNYNIVTVRADGAVIVNVAGFTVIVTAAMHRAAANCQTNTAGKIDQTVTSNNTKSGIVGVRWDQWRMALKRRMTMEVERFGDSDTNQIICHMRMKLHNRDNEGAAYTYNLS